MSEYKNLNITTAAHLITKIVELKPDVEAQYVTPDTFIKHELLDSLEYAELILELETKYKIIFNDREMTYDVTVGDLSNLIDQKVNNKPATND